MYAPSNGWKRSEGATLRWSAPVATPTPLCRKPAALVCVASGCGVMSRLVSDCRLQRDAPRASRSLLPVNSLPMPESHVFCPDAGDSATLDDVMSVLTSPPRGEYDGTERLNPCSVTSTLALRCCCGSGGMTSARVDASVGVMLDERLYLWCALV